MPFNVSKRCAADVGAEFHARAVPRVQLTIVGPLKTVLDIQIGIAAAPAGELRRAGKLARIVERDARETEERRGKQRQVILLREPDAVLPVPKMLPLWRT